MWPCTCVAGAVRARDDNAVVRVRVVDEDGRVVCRSACRGWCMHGAWARRWVVVGALHAIAWGIAWGSANHEAAQPAERRPLHCTCINASAPCGWTRQRMRPQDRGTRERGCCSRACKSPKRPCHMITDVPAQATCQHICTRAMCMLLPEVVVWASQSTVEP